MAHVGQSGRQNWALKFYSSAFDSRTSTLLDERWGASRQLWQKGEIITNGMGDTDFVAVEAVQVSRIWRYGRYVDGREINNLCLSEVPLEP